ncbi:MAG: hypothetical protein JW787_15220, partial [Sedimentisphaerales bacterium]|nr:hypothetical protein [Sedimentisphaerales bacterium]
ASFTLTSTLKQPTYLLVIKELAQKLASFFQITFVSRIWYLVCSLLGQSHGIAPTNSPIF